MKDIEHRHDLEILLTEFYNRLLANPAISYMFTDVAKINLEEHLPHIIDFWEQSLFYTGNYRKNVMQIHLHLNQKKTITEEHFAIWLEHFNSVSDSLYSGPNTEKLKTRALSITTIMKVKIYTS